MFFFNYYDSFFLKASLSKDIGIKQNIPPQLGNQIMFYVSLAAVPDIMSQYTLPSNVHMRVYACECVC